MLRSLDGADSACRTSRIAVHRGSVRNPPFRRTDAGRAVWTHSIAHIFGRCTICLAPLYGTIADCAGQRPLLPSRRGALVLLSLSRDKRSATPLRPARDCHALALAPCRLRLSRRCCVSSSPSPSVLRSTLAQCRRASSPGRACAADPASDASPDPSLVSARTIIAISIAVLVALGVVAYLTLLRPRWVRRAELADQHHSAPRSYLTPLRRPVPASEGFGARFGRLEMAQADRPPLLRHPAPIYRP